MDKFSSVSRGWFAAGGGFLAAAAATAWAAHAGNGKFLGFVSVGMVIAGFSLGVPGLVAGAARAVPWPGLMMRLGARQLTRSLHRAAVTIAALSVAAAMTVSVSVMIHSFRESVSRWLGTTLAADLFIAPAANEVVGLSGFLPARAVEWARGDARVREAGTFREMPARMGGEAVFLGVVEGNARGRWDYVARAPGADRLFREPGHVHVTESFANRHAVGPGDRIPLMTPGEEVEFVVAGVVKDFTRDAGLVMIERGVFERHWSDARVHSVALSLHDPSRAGEVEADFRAALGDDGQFAVYTNAGLRARVMDIFDATFAVTGVLRAVAVVVAVAGVWLSLTTMVVERGREIGVLRSMGASAGQVRGILLAESGLIGVFSSVVGVACGSAMAMILTWVINKAFFGWTISLRYPWDTLASTPLWIVPAALLAALVPALRASRIPPARALRFE